MASDTPLLLGVRHRPQYIDCVIGALSQENIRRRKVMLEITAHPIPSKYWGRNRNFCEFFDSIAQYVITQGGIIIPGDSDELVERAQQKMDSIKELFFTHNSRYMAEADRISCEERDPYFLSVAREQEPGIIILAKRHANYLDENLQCRYIIVPSQN